MALAFDDINWRKPGCYKLVTRVNVRKFTNMASAGGTLRDGNDGKWIFCFSKKLGETSRVEAELLALRRGLEMAWERRIPRVEAEMDSEIMAEINKAESEEKHPLRSLVEECRALLERPWETNLSYTDGTSFATDFAEIGHDLDEDFKLWEEPPMEFLVGIRVTLNEDI